MLAMALIPVGIVVVSLAWIPAVHIFDRGDAEAVGYRCASARAATASIAAMDANARFSPVADNIAYGGDPVAGATAAARSSGRARRLVPCLAGGQP